MLFDSIQISAGAVIDTGQSQDRAMTMMIIVWRRGRRRTTRYQCLRYVDRQIEFVRERIVRPPDGRNIGNDGEIRRRVQIRHGEPRRSIVVVVVVRMFPQNGQGRGRQRRDVPYRRIIILRVVPSTRTTTTTTTLRWIWPDPTGLPPFMDSSFSYSTGVTGRRRRRYLKSEQHQEYEDDKSWFEK